MGNTPPEGHRRLGHQNGAPQELVELKDAITKLVGIQTERHKADDEWRIEDDRTHQTLIAKVARQSVYIGIGAALVGGMVG